MSRSLKVTAPLALLGLLAWIGFALGDNDHVRSTPSVDACSRALVMRGLGLSWKKLNHRISLWRVAPRQDGCPTAMPADVPLDVAYVGGSWTTGGGVMSDRPIAHYHYHAVDAPEQLGFYAGQTTLFIDAPADEAQTNVKVDLAAARLTGFARYVVLLDGLELRTDVPQVDPAYPAKYNPALGYTSRGIGAAVKDLEINENKASFTTWARFDHGPADRGGMNEAMAHARTKAIVHYLLVGIADGKATLAEHAYTMTYDKPRLLFQPQYDHAPPAMRRLEMQAAPGYPVAFQGLQAFDFALFGSVEEGDYMRDFVVRTDLLSYDPATGKTVLDVDGFASNASLLTYERMENAFSARLALIQLTRGSAVPGDKVVEFETGEAIILLP